MSSPVLLLLIEVIGAFLSAVADIEKHGTISQDDQQTQLPAQDKKQDQSSRHLDKTLDDHGEAVVKSVGDGIHVVGEAAHGVAVRVLVKIFQRKFLPWYGTDPGGYRR